MHGTGEETTPIQLEWNSDDVVGKGITPPSMTVGVLPLDVENWAAIIATLQSSSDEAR